MAVLLGARFAAAAGKPEGAAAGARKIRFALPVSQAGVATVATFVFLSVWNEFLFALLMLADPFLRTLNLSVYMLRGQYTSDQGLMASGVVILIAPAILMYVLFQEQIVKGLTAGAIKG